MLSKSEDEEPIIAHGTEYSEVRCTPKEEDKISLGNNFADQTAKAAAKRETEPGKGMLVLTRAQIAKKLNAYNNRTEMIDTIIKQNNMWFPRMQEKVNEFLTQFHPQSQGRVERMNQTLKRKLTKICAQTGLNWVTVLPIALMAIGGSTNRGTKLTSHEMVTGRRTPRGNRKTIEIEDIDKLKSELDKYVTILTKIHASIA